MRREIAGWFRTGRLVGDQPESLSNWRVTTSRPETAGTIAQLLGGQPQAWQTAGEFDIEVLTERPKVEILLSRMGITMEMKLWGLKGLLHHCDGYAFLSPAKEAGEPCGCPTDTPSRIAYAKSGHGPEPHTELHFQLRDARNLGSFRFRSNSWNFARITEEIGRNLTTISGNALCELGIKTVSSTTNSGMHFSYCTPVVEMLRP